MYRNWWSKQIKPEVLLPWTGNVHLCTNLLFTFLVGSPWKSSVVREKSLKMTAIFCMNPDSVLLFFVTTSSVQIYWNVYYYKIIIISLILVPFLHPWVFSITVEALLWDTSIQGTPPFKGKKFWSRKNVHIIFVSVTSIEGTPLFRG